MHHKWGTWSFRVQSLSVYGLMNRIYFRAAIEPGAHETDGIWRGRQHGIPGSDKTRRSPGILTDCLLAACPFIQLEVELPNGHDGLGEGQEDAVVPDT